MPIINKCLTTGKSIQEFTRDPTNLLLLFSLELILYLPVVFNANFPAYNSVYIFNRAKSHLFAFGGALEENIMLPPA